MKSGFEVQGINITTARYASRSRHAPSSQPVLKGDRWIDFNELNVAFNWVVKAPGQAVTYWRNRFCIVDDMERASALECVSTNARSSVQTRHPKTDHCHR